MFYFSTMFFLKNCCVCWPISHAKLYFSPSILHNATAMLCRNSYVIIIIENAFTQISVFYNQYHYNKFMRMISTMCKMEISIAYLGHHRIPIISSVTHVV